MDSQDRLFAIFWILAALILTILIIGISAVKITDSNNITKLVMNGVHPTQAYCAINNATDGRCIIATIGAKRD